MGRRFELAGGVALAAGCLVSAPRERKAREAETKIRETRGGVTVTRTFPDAIIKPERPTMPPEPGPALVVQDVYCVFCHGTNVGVLWVEERERGYRCYSCVDPETGTWTTFKLQRRQPPLKRAASSPSSRGPSSPPPSSSEPPRPRA